MSPQKLQNLLKKWQKILYLQDWTITVKFVDKEDLDEDTFGKSSICDELKIIKIKILKSEDITDDLNKDIEQTLVHELLHAHFEVVYANNEESTVRHVFYEQAIEQISRSLINLDRK